jgi:hypothetical protein
MNFRPAVPSFPRIRRVLPNERCSRQALFGCGFAAMVVLCLQLN